MATEPDNPDLIRLQKNSLINLSNAYLDVNKPAEARQCLEQTQQLIETLRRFDSTKEELDIDEITCQIRLARCRFSEDTTNGYRSGIAILNNARQIHQSRMDSSRFKELSLSAQNLANDIKTFTDWANRKLLKRQSQVRDVSWPLIFEPL